MERNAKFVVRRDEAARVRLQAMVDRGPGPKTIRNRALILLKADEGEGGSGWTDAKIAEAFGVGVRTVERTRRLLVVEGLEAVLVRKPSPNRQYRKLDGAQGAARVPLACSKPPHGRARWTLQRLADRLVELEVAPAIGREAVRTTLQKATSSRGSASTGYYPRRPMPSSSVRWKTSSGCTTGRTTRSAPRYASTKPPSNGSARPEHRSRVRPGNPRARTTSTRNGTVNPFVVFEPLAGRRRVKVTARRTKVDFARVIRERVDEQYPGADKIVLVMDNLNTHRLSSRYEAFAPEEARRLIERLEVTTPPSTGPGSTWPRSS